MFLLTIAGIAEKMKQSYQGGGCEHPHTVLLGREVDSVLIASVGNS